MEKTLKKKKKGLGLKKNRSLQRRKENTFETQVTGRSRSLEERKARAGKEESVGGKAAPCRSTQEKESPQNGG